MAQSNPLRQIHDFGQSIWMDFIRRSILDSGELKRLIDEDGLRGVTSNPAIFEKAIAGSNDYDDAIESMARAGKSIDDIYQALTVEDVQRAADLFRGVYDDSEGGDGFVSLEVSPLLALDTEGTIAEGRRLWAAVDRPNVMIKVPATREGLPAIEQLISDGINVNVTLLFGLPRYREVVDAYLSGLEARARRGEPIDRIASVASFFLSRIDVLVDPMLEARMDDGGPAADRARALLGEVAIASARIAYQIYKDLFGGDRFQALADRGARPQRLLWASTSTKNPVYSDVKYVEPLIGPDTVNTLPVETIEAYRDHGRPAARLEDHVDQAQRVLNQLADLDIDLDAVTAQLVEEGIDKFVQPFDKLMDALAGARAAVLVGQVDGQALHLGSYMEAVNQRLRSLAESDAGARLWRKDAGLWKDDPKDQHSIRNALGWLHVAEKMQEHIADLNAFADDVRAAGFRHVVHMGMGGSSLAPLVFQQSLAPTSSGLPLTVLDTTDPATIHQIAETVPLDKTLFITASKSGTTAEPLGFDAYFYDRVKALNGDAAGQQFVVITDPGSPLADQARERGYRRVFTNFEDIGGRYSALSFFGLVPAALMGVDLEALLKRTLNMAQACASSVPVAKNPGVVLGAVMGTLALQGRDKVTFIVPERLDTLGLWLEQLIAESTGKEGTGILPVALEPLSAASTYGPDRLFVHVHLNDEDETLDQHVADLKAAGHPVVVIEMHDALDLGQEFLRWEIATAIAGVVLGINPFDQPNVQESKDNTNHLLDIVRSEGALPDEEPDLTERGLSVYAPEAASSLEETLKQFFSHADERSYVALMAYLQEEPATDEALQTLRKRLHEHLHVATTLGYGPRYLHSTGQLHKGGPDTGLFIQLTADDPIALDLPGQPYTFSVFKQAQAQGDLEALYEHGRRALRIHLGADVVSGLNTLNRALEHALSGVSA